MKRHNIANGRYTFVHEHFLRFVSFWNADQGEDVRAVLDRKMQTVQQEVFEHPEIEVTYFQPDEQKSGALILRFMKK